MDFTHASLFSGIGGFDYAAELMGWQNLFHCEWNTFCQKVLAYHFPNSIPHHDITKTDFTIYRGRVDILTGGFPCQPYSVVGEQKGSADERHLWPEMLRAIRQIKPRFIVGENVPGLVSWSGGLVFEQVQADLETSSYEVTPFLLPAAGINSPHTRERIWFIAYSDTIKKGLQSAKQTELPGTNRNNQRRAIAELYKTQSWNGWPTQSPICNGNDGLSARMAGISFRRWRTEALRAGGNAIVPQVALQIFKAISEYEKLYL